MGPHLCPCIHTHSTICFVLMLKMALTSMTVLEPTSVLCFHSQYLSVSSSVSLHLCCFVGDIPEVQMLLKLDRATFTSSAVIFHLIYKAKSVCVCVFAMRACFLLCRPQNSLCRLCGQPPFSTYHSH